MSTYGKIEEFDRDSDTWELYIERLNFYFEASQIEGEGDGLKFTSCYSPQLSGKENLQVNV